MIQFEVTFPHALALIVLPMEEGIAEASPVVEEEAVAAVAGKPL